MDLPKTSALFREPDLNIHHQPNLLSLRPVQLFLDSFVDAPDARVKMPLNRWYGLFFRFLKTATAPSVLSFTSPPECRALHASLPAFENSHLLPSKSASLSALALICVPSLQPWLAALIPSLTFATWPVVRLPSPASGSRCGWPHFCCTFCRWRLWQQLSPHISRLPPPPAIQKLFQASLIQSF